MAEDDGLLLNLFSHSDGNGEVNQGKRNRKLKVKYSIFEGGNQTRINLRTYCILKCVHV